MKGQSEMHTKFWLETMKGRDHSDHVSVGRRIILNWNIKKYGGC
jgi:hypothetical protein